ncbi:hypothetical protein CXB51_005033 [Gossypium anomalum]|uniref:Uncharacterized protein n=1 Tax=Gossypium anomalum TaxID=47600 RepID=A0A8J5ZVQ4_9ROSI|nr:hypothetical protein CXB51_005033 [Gossypium anomalum]
MKAFNLQQLSKLLRTPFSNHFRQSKNNWLWLENRVVLPTNPSPIYQEVLVDKVMILRRFNDFLVANLGYLSIGICKTKVEALEKAGKLESGLDTHSPIFIKSMLQSHVTSRFWLMIVELIMPAPT